MRKNEVQGFIPDNKYLQDLPTPRPPMRIIKEGGGSSGGVFMLIVVLAFIVFPLLSGN
jgi:hypothetical protein